MGAITNALSKWREFTHGRQPEYHPRGSMLYTPEQPAHDLMLLVDGRVNLYLRSDESRTLTLRTVIAGELLGHVAMAREQMYDTFAETASNVQVYRISHDAASAMIIDNPPLGLALLDDLGKHRLTISERLEEVAFKSVPARLASLLLNMASHHDGPLSMRVPRHSHRQLAEMVNAYRETVTKIINQFRDARILEIDRSFITLINRSRLEELAQGW